MDDVIPDVGDDVIHNLVDHLMGVRLSYPREVRFGEPQLRGSCIHREVDWWERGRGRKYAIGLLLYCWPSGRDQD